MFCDRDCECDSPRPNARNDMTPVVLSGKLNGKVAFKFLPVTFEDTDQNIDIIDVSCGFVPKNEK